MKVQETPQREPAGAATLDGGLDGGRGDGPGPDGQPGQAHGAAVRRRRPRGGDPGKYGILVVWVAMALAFTILRPETFATWGNVSTIAGSQAVLLFITLGLIVPLAAGEFDLSVSGVAGVALVLTGWLNVVHGWPILAVIAIVLAAGLVIGAVNAFFVVYVGIDSIVVTLGTGTLLVGLGLAINEATIGGVSPALVDAVRTEVAGIPAIFFYGVLLTAIVWYVFSHTPFGRYLYFTGFGRNVVRLAGVPVDRIRALTFVFASGASALAGVLLAGWLGGADPNVGTGYLLPAFAAAFLGTSVIVPGRFNAWGAFVAVFFLSTGITGLQLMGLAGWIEQVFYGASLVLAVTFARLIARRSHA